MVSRIMRDIREGKAQGPTPKPAPIKKLTSLIYR